MPKGLTTHAPVTQDELEKRARITLLYTNLTFGALAVLVTVLSLFDLERIEVAHLLTHNWIVVMVITTTVAVGLFVHFALSGLASGTFVADERQLKVWRVASVWVNIGQLVVLVVGVYGLANLLMAQSYQEELRVITASIDSLQEVIAENEAGIARSREGIRLSELATTLYEASTLVAVIEQYKQVNGQYPERLNDVFPTDPIVEGILQALDSNKVSYNADSEVGYVLRIEGFAGTNDDKVVTGVTGREFIEMTTRQGDSVRALVDSLRGLILETGN